MEVELLVDVTFVIDDETVTTVVVVGGGGVSLPHATTNTIEAATITTIDVGPPPFASLPANAQIHTIAPPRGIDGQADVDTVAR